MRIRIRIKDQIDQIHQRIGIGIKKREFTGFKIEIKISFTKLVNNFGFF